MESMETPVPEDMGFHGIYLLKMVISWDLPIKNGDFMGFNGI
jgi:hypothetical protein